MEQDRELADDVTLLECIQYLNRTIIAQYLKINTAIDKKEYFATFIIEIQNHMIFLVYVILQIKLYRL